jgi:hypothetical protein
VNADEHRKAGEAAMKAAADLRSGASPWAAVALHYCAMHALHAHISDREDVRDEDRHPTTHRGYMKGGVRVLGTNDVVRRYYPEHDYPRVAVAYRSLCSASHAVRYSTAPKALLERVWEDADVVLTAVGWPGPQR